MVTIWLSVSTFYGTEIKDHKVIKTRSLKRSDKYAFLADASGIYWDRSMNGTDDVNMLASNSSNLLYLIIDKHALLKCMFQPLE